MRHEGSFVADRLGAQHCAELTRSSRQAVNPLVELAQFAERLASLVAEKLSQTFPGVAVEVTANEPAELQANVNERRGEPVFNTTFAAGERDITFYASLPQSAALAMVDLALGGNGSNCDAPGGKLPLSAQLMFERFEKNLDKAIADAFEFPVADAVRIRKSGAVPEASLPFSGCKRMVLTMRVVIGAAAPQEMVLTFPGAAPVGLFAHRANPGAPAARAGGVVSPNSEPFGGIPLSLKAILVDMPIPVSALSNLAPGTIIPVAVARSVPLMVGEQVIGHGTVGSLDDRAALQLTKLNSNKEI
jgi:flagellar motor switch protein FliM